MIGVSKEELDIIDTPVFQRLHNISQLALTKLVYPGATHTRFEHCLGAMHIAGKIADKLGFPYQNIRQIRIAALLHDIGHGPFSHVFEQILRELEANINHEMLSMAIVSSKKHLPRLSKTMRKNVKALLSDSSTRSVEGDIISGPTDADKLDYLLRDSYYAGVKYGVYDLTRILDTVISINNGLETHLGFTEGGLWAVEGLLLARHHMHRQVYGHRTRMVTDIMLTRIIKLAVDTGQIEKSQIIPQSNNPRSYLDIFIKLSEFGLLSKINDGPAKDLLDRLDSRRLLKRIATLKFEELSDTYGSMLTSYLDDREKFTKAKIGECEKLIANQIGCKDYLVALQIDTNENPTYRPPGYDINKKDILFQRESKPAVVMNDISEIFSNDRSEKGRKFIHLYCENDNHDEVVKNKATTALSNILTSLAKGGE